MRTIPKSNPPKYCSTCGTLLKEISKEYNDIRYDIFTGQKLPPRITVLLTCYKHSVTNYHSEWILVGSDWVKG